MTRQITTSARLSTRLVRFGRRVADVIAECDYAQRRLIMLMTSTDAYLADRDRVPDDYAEFLLRTSGGLLREPTAGRRTDGQPVG